MTSILNSGHPSKPQPQSGKTKVVENLLKRKPDPNVTGGRLHSALQAGAYSGNLEIVQALLNTHATVDAYGAFVEVHYMQPPREGPLKWYSACCTLMLIRT